jgi:hypothetical protein
MKKTFCMKPFLILILVINRSAVLLCKKKEQKYFNTDFTVKETVSITFGSIVNFLLFRSALCPLSQSHLPTSRCGSSRSDQFFSPGDQAIRIQV